ncbi:hypothetical protein S40285_01700 [Stachybotrys chlorohalonatus IBT 40285]|uniref:RNA helicase n=1 Tax=Stachybotrys chlorohalonatus (strain IBT 40285) TaxID=1283841 RepID=A0A084QDS5_STAC4|nr:hypothetical protein S40285_01700 [Stachybotrys chlorohalonata IBT 40285]
MAKFVPRQRKHKVLARQRAKENGRHEAEDSNQDVLLPAQKTQQDLQERKARLKDELQQEQGSKVSGKKAKRLEKYIENKLKKDENRELLAKLADRKIDTSLFKSSKSLGQGHETKRQASSRALQEQKAGIGGGEAQDSLLYERRGPGGSDDESSSEEDAIAPTKAPIAGSTGDRELIVAGTGNGPAKATPVPARANAIGSGLKRPLDLDEEGRPVIQKRQRRGGVKSKASVVHLGQPVIQALDHEEWRGFSDDDDETPNRKLEVNGQDNDSLDDRSDDEDSEDGSNSEAGAKLDEDSDEDEDEPGDSDEDTDNDDRPQRSSGFKAWALAQRNEAMGFQPTNAMTTALAIPKPDNFKPRALEQDPLPAELQPIENTQRKVYSVTVTRTPEVQEARLKLPVVAEEQRLMEAIHNHDIVVICGSTGSGKTTQIPQFLYEAGYGSPGSPTPGMVGITQPRRVAAVSMSRRVAEELGDHSGVVSYQIRYEGTVNPKTAVKFMTDGVLLREIAQDFALRKYSAIIIDEAHERSVNTDILIGMLSRVIKLRKELAEEDPKMRPLKLIIMSATLRIDDLTKNPTLFPNPPPVIEVEGRQYPVTMHFSRETKYDYVEEAFQKITRGHRKLPPGGFLVFLTGRNEILQLSKRLKTAFGGLQTADGPKVEISANDAPLEVEDIEYCNVDDRVDDGSLDLPSDNEEGNNDDEFQIEEDQQAAPLKLQILPLYSLLPTREQLRVFQTPPEGTRQIILATNVAETSLTIPGIRFVFDCGRSKERRYDPVSGVQSFQISWISKASANQRSGRAGRTGPGHCYRLYSSAYYERDFPAFGEPEILRMPIEGVVLQLKAMNLQHVVNFPFPTPPDRQSLAKAEKLLQYMSAITSEGKVSQVGKTMSLFPVSPRLARILLLGHHHDCLQYAIALVAGLSAAEVWVPENDAIPSLAARDENTIRTNEDIISEDRQANIRRMFNKVHQTFCFLDDRSDAIKLLQVVGEFAHQPTEAWCESHFVRYKVLKEVHQLRKQITELFRINIPAFKSLRYQDKLDPPTPTQVSALKQMVAAGFIDQVAIRADRAPNPPEHYRNPRRAIDIPYLPLMPLHTVKGPEDDPYVYIHPTSPLAHLSTQECPEYLVYAHLQRADLTSARKAKTRMHALTDVSGRQLAELAKGTPLITYGKPIKETKKETIVNRVLTRECVVVPYLRAENTSGQGWPLPATIVKQKKIAAKGWVVE